MHAWLPPYSPLGLYAPSDLARQARGATEFLEQELAGVDESTLVDRIERRPVEQRPNEALIDAAGYASLIVAGTRGRGHVAKTLLGSVSDQVSQHATCPVVIVR